MVTEEEPPGPGPPVPIGVEYVTNPGGVRNSGRAPEIFHSPSNFTSVYLTNRLKKYLLRALSGILLLRGLRQSLCAKNLAFE